MRRKGTNWFDVACVAAIAIVLIGVAIFVFSATSHGALTDCIDATCRITSGNARGTGCCFEVANGSVYVLTNAHVVGGKRQVECEFWSQGHQSRKLTGTVVALARDPADAAVISIPIAQFGGRLPVAVPLAGRNVRLSPGQTIISAGCAKGAWSTAWKGHVLQETGDDVRFTPTPADGRSGSAIFNEDGTQIVALLNARAVDSSHGIAVSLGCLYRNLSTKAAYEDIEERLTQWGGQQGGCDGNGSCPGGQCLPAPQSPSSGNSGILGRLRGGLGGGSGAYPTLPSPSDPQSGIFPGVNPLPSPRTPLPSPQQGNSSQLEYKLDRMNDSLQGILGELRGSRIAGPMYGDNRGSLPPEATANQAMALATDNRSKLREWIEDNRSIRDKIKDKIAGGGMMAAVSSLGFSGPLAIAIVLAAFLVVRKIKSGEPLLIQRVIEGLHDKVDDVREKVSAKRSTSRK